MIVIFRSRRRRARPCYVSAVLLLAAAWAAILRPIPAAAGDTGSLNKIQVVKSFAEIFKGQQNSDGSYATSLNVQTHLKAEIGMALAAEVTGRHDFVDSARRDMDWVVAQRLESNGGISWGGPQDNYFFEVHQHWFLIASELIRLQELGAPADTIKDLQRKVWLFLLRGNPAAADFYNDNLTRHGVFFAYRDIDREGNFQTQAPFKGSYEIGAALWSLALHRADGWLIHEPGAPIDSSIAPSRYLERMLPQITLPLEQHGFFDAQKGLWIRSVLWNGSEWTGYVTQDFKYAPHMEEGVLLFSLLTGRNDLLGPARSQLDALVSFVRPDGSIRGVPDEHGTAPYEYGTILSCLGLGAQVFRQDYPEVGGRALAAAERVFQYAAATFPAISGEDQAMLLAGFCRVIEAERQAQGPVGKSRLTLPLSAGLRVEGLAAWPNPMRDRIRFLLQGAPNATGILRIIDATGRNCLTRFLSSDTHGQMALVWDGADEGGRRLPSGSYQAIVETGRTRTGTGFAIIR